MDITEILAKIQESNKSASFTSWSPTLQKNVKFVGFNSGHQQNFVQNLMDSPFLNAPFVVSLAKAIGESWIDDVAFDPSALTVQDKAAFMTNIWINSYDIPRSRAIKDLYKTPEQSAPSDKTISHLDYMVTINFPSILKEAQYSKYMHEWATQNFKPDENGSVSLLNSLLYLLEPLVYIKSLKIKEDVIDLNELDISTQVELGRNLPISLIKKVDDTIAEFFTPLLNKIKTVSTEEGETVINLNNSDFILTD